jgi:glycosyltransferase involved in cell wall biosynthesis
MIRLLFLIRDLEVGGTQRQLVELVRALDKRRFVVTVATFYDGGTLRAELRGQPGIRVVSLHKTGRWDLIGFGLRLLRLARQVRPHIVHGYLDNANELSLLAGRLTGARVVWGLRGSGAAHAPGDRLGAALTHAGAGLSRFADLLIVNSAAGRRYYHALGYPARRLMVIRNGIDTARFRPDPAAWAAQRHAWQIGPDVALVGLVGRIDPLKDHATFLQAAARLAAICPAAQFVCVGDGPAVLQQQLVAQAATLGLESRLRWVGTGQAMPQIYNALDLLVSSSISEGFSNVIAEAMACGVPCVVTAVGDSARLVGNPAQVVPPRDPARLAHACARLLALPPAGHAARGAAARARIVRHFSVAHLAAQTERALRDLRNR